MLSLGQALFFYSVGILLGFLIMIPIYLLS